LLQHDIRDLAPAGHFGAIRTSNETRAANALRAARFPRSSKNRARSCRSRR
jgi:hypothetical protein